MGGARSLGLGSRLAFKRSAMAVGLPDEGLFFPFLPRREGFFVRPEPWQRALMELLDGERTLGVVLALLPLVGHDVDAGEALSFIDRLDELCLLEEGRDETMEVDDRYCRQRLFFGGWRREGLPFADEAQRRIAEARVVLFGVGGGGSHLLQNLLSLGVGQLTLVDFDVVEPSNLNRQCLYRPGDVGRSKIDVLRRELPLWNGDIDYRFIEGRMDGVEALSSAMEGHDLALLTADSPREAIFSWFDEALYRSHTAGLFTAGVTLTSLSLGPLVIPGRTACYRCSLPPWRPDFSRPEVRAINAGYRHGVMAPHVALVGGLMALEVTRFLTGFEAPLTEGARLVLDLSNWEARRVVVTPRPDCPRCGRGPEGGERPCS